MDELAAFILARVTEDEVLLGTVSGDSDIGAERMLAECESKRMMVAHIQRIDWDYEPAGDQDYMRRLLELLALPWIGHSDYDEHWVS